MDPLEPARPSSLAAFLALFLLCSAAFFWMIKGFLVAIFMGQVLAFLLGPLYARLRRRRLGSTASALTATLLLFFLVAGPLTGFCVVAVREGLEMKQTFVENGGLTAGAALERLRRVGLDRLGADPARLKDQARETLRAGANAAAGHVERAVRSLPKLFVALALALLTAFFLLRDEDSLLRLTLAPLPLEPSILSEAQSAFQATAAATVWAALAAATVQSATVLATFLLLGLRGAWLAGGLAFVFAWVPLVSTSPIWLSAAAWLVYQGRHGALTALLIIGALAYALDHALRPMLLRGRARLHPLLGLVSVLGGLEAFGLAGVFVGPVLASLVAALYRVWPRTAARHQIDVQPTVVGPG